MKNAAKLTAQRRFENLERETGLEPATLSLGNRQRTPKLRDIRHLALQKDAPSGTWVHARRHQTSPALAA
jgi:hypothetical protein